MMECSGSFSFPLGQQQLVLAALLEKQRVRTCDYSSALPVLPTGTSTGVLARCAGVVTSC